MCVSLANLLHLGLSIIEAGIEFGKAVQLLQSNHSERSPLGPQIQEPLHRKSRLLR